MLCKLKLTVNVQELFGPNVPPVICKLGSKFTKAKDMIEPAPQNPARGGLERLVPSINAERLSLNAISVAVKV